MCIRWISWISCVSTYKGTFNLSFTLVTVLMFPRSRDPPLPFSEVFLLDRSLLDLHHYFLLLLVILLHTFRIFKWVDHHLFQKPWGFAEHCWTTLTLPHRSCYCRSFSSSHWSDFRWWTTGWDATKHVEFSTNDDDDESNTDELTMFMLVCVSTMSGATNGYFWSGTLRF